MFLEPLFAPMDDQAWVIYEKHNGRTDSPTELFSEAYAICGRRSGKTLSGNRASSTSRMVEDRYDIQREDPLSGLEHEYFTGPGGAF
jgi:hypothetical protein